MLFEKSNLIMNSKKVENMWRFVGAILNTFNITF